MRAMKLGSVLALCKCVCISALRAGLASHAKPAYGASQVAAKLAPGLRSATTLAFSAAAIPSAAFALDFDFVRDPVDAYYAVVVIVGILYLVNRAGGQAIEDARDYDRRGELANKMAQEARRRDVAARRREVLEAEPETLRRMEAEKGQRAERKQGWKIFDADDT